MRECNEQAIIGFRRLSTGELQAQPVALAIALILQLLAIKTKRQEDMVCGL